MIRVSISQLIENVQRLNEDKRGNIMRLLGLPMYIADYFHERAGPKYSFLFARWFKEKSTDVTLKALRDVDNAVKTGTAPKSVYDNMITAYARSFMLDRLDGEATVLLNMLNNGFLQFRDVKNLSFLDAIEHYDEQVLKAKKKRRRLELKDNTILSFDDGYFWYDTKSNICDKWISDKMQHCGQDDTGHLQILFDDKLEPHVTLTWNKEDGEVTQLVGKQNRYPEEKYWPHIYDLIVDKDLGISSTVAQGEFGEYIDEREMAANPHVADADDPLDYPEHYQLQENKRNIRLIIS